MERLQAQLPEGGLPDKQALERARDQVAQLRGLDNSLKQAAQAVPEAQAAWEEAQARAEDPGVCRGGLRGPEPGPGGGPAD